MRFTLGRVPEPPRMVDVVVVGAGFAGLAAARELSNGSATTCVVLEGRDRVGGRSLHRQRRRQCRSISAARSSGPTQDAVLALAAELGCPTVPTYHDGKNLIHWRGRVALVPRHHPAAFADRAARRRPDPVAVRPDRPAAFRWPSRGRPPRPRTGRLVARRLAAVGARRRASTRDLMAIMARVTWGCEPDEVSMLHAVRYVQGRGRPGPDARRRGRRPTGPLPRRHAADRRGRGRRTRRPGGAGRPGPPHRAARRRASTVTTDRGETDAGSVIVAIPPAHRAGIEFAPPLPAEYEQLARHWPQGRLSKAYAAYATPFWRANGFSGRGAVRRGPGVHHLRRQPARQTGPASCWASSTPARSTRCPAISAARDALRCFATLFGDAALKPLDYVDHRWGAEEFAPGGPTAAVPPGSWTRYGPWLREPGRADSLGGHRNRRRMDRVPRRRGPLRAARGRRGRARLLRADTADGRVCTAHRFGESAQVAVHLARAFQHRAVPAGQFDQTDEVRRGACDPAGLADRQSAGRVRCR